MAADRLLSIKHELSGSQKCWNMVSMNPKQIIWQLLSCYFNRVAVLCVVFLQDLIWVPNDRDTAIFAFCWQVKLGPSKWAGMVGGNSWVTCGGDSSCLIFVRTGYIEEACIIPCPSDCKLSEWSNWSRCSRSCGSGVKVRSKWLREKPYNGGRPCPKLDHVNQLFAALGNIVKYVLDAHWSLFFFFLPKIENI